jgi:hypothetical protein
MRPEGQSPIPENVMAVYKQVLMKCRDGWFLITYVQDSYGRMWSTKTAASPPVLGLGEQLMPDELDGSNYHHVENQRHDVFRKPGAFTATRKPETLSPGMSVIDPPYRCDAS